MVLQMNKARANDSGLVWLCDQFVTAAGSEVSPGSRKAWRGDRGQLLST